MMRWKLWDDTKDGEPPQYAVHICGNEWMVLQHQVTFLENGNGSYKEWEDVPLHIESKT
jgi:hypothetical protein